MLNAVNVEHPTSAKKKQTEKSAKMFVCVELVGNFSNLAT